MKFGHIADVHLGAYRDPKLRELGLQAFSKVIDRCIESNVEFLLLSGDLFNTSLPSIDVIKFAVKQLKRLKDKRIRVYSISGSHDYSPSGKTMLDVIEEAGLCINVSANYDPNRDEYNLLEVRDQSGAVISGIEGRKGALDTKIYSKLSIDGDKKSNEFRIFMFHTAIEELKPEELVRISASPLSMLPKGYNYYAGGHVHIVRDVSLDGYDNVVYPGPVFPNNFSELSKLKYGGFYLYDNGKLNFETVKVKDVEIIEIDANYKTPEVINEELAGLEIDVKDKIVLIKIFGTMNNGKTTDIEFKKIFGKLYGDGAYYVMRNTLSLKSKEYEDVGLDVDTPEDAEMKIIDEQIGKNDLLGLGLLEKDFVNKVILNLAVEKHEGEKQTDYERRVLDVVESVFGDVERIKKEVIREKVVEK